MNELLLNIPAFLIDYIVSIIFALVAAFLLPLVYKLFKMKADDKRRVLIEAAIQNGIKWAIQQAIVRAARDTETPQGQYSMSKVINEVAVAPAQTVEDAAAYVKNGVSGSLASLKVDDQTLRQRIEARLPRTVVGYNNTGQLL